jgi:hypothetical protein
LIKFPPLGIDYIHHILKYKKLLKNETIIINNDIVPIQNIVDGLEDGIGPRMQPNTEGIAGTSNTLPP